MARSLIPAGTATLRDFSYIAPDIPEYIPENCTGCMDCVTLCPDTAILGKVLSESDWKKKMDAITDPADREMFAKQWSKTRKYYEGPAKKQGEGGMFNIIIDPSKCKGLRGVRHRLRRPGAENDSQDRAGDDLGPQEPPLVQGVWPVRQAVRQRQPADRHDAAREDAHLHRRRGLLRRLRRRDRPAHDVRRDRREVRRPVGHHRRHRLQHGLYLDVSV